MSEIKNRATRLKSRGKRADIDEDLCKSQKQTDCNDCLNWTHASPNCKQTDRANQRNNNKLRSHAVGNLSQRLSNERTSSGRSIGFFSLLKRLIGR